MKRGQLNYEYTRQFDLDLIVSIFSFALNLFYSRIKPSKKERKKKLLLIMAKTMAQVLLSPFFVYQQQPTIFVVFDSRMRRKL